MADTNQVKPTDNLDTSADTPLAQPNIDGANKDASVKHVRPTTEIIQSGKRQRTLMDMLSGTKDKKSVVSEPSAKKLKFSDPGPSSSLELDEFSISAYIETLSEEEKRLLSLECETMGKSWLNVLKSEIREPYFLKLKRFLWEEGVKGLNDSSKGLKVFPAPRNIYAWSNTPLGKVKVVIIGQDPYHGENQAHGLCFSVLPGIAVPPSLRNIYAELKAEYPNFVPPKHGTLTAWANNGVLLLNTCLTVRAHQAGSHSNKGWEQFTDKVIDAVDKYGGVNLSAGSSENSGVSRGIVFLAWGAWAAKRVAKLNTKKHLILKSAHPSPLSASRGFLGNGHFQAANRWLKQKYGPEARVDWCNLEVVQQ
ncbi:hypothetical protein AMATHDRAFT_55551 [Amanita thiersii Skay4041]|uniref:Uracil-DNA glycosylase n=1 Tax=Amanita thiersii Skay4041 TaxID=703135 RepID=A0A2A9NQ49_9AGAR|nr:hypothetical protein AMATHDRAFT_55551 [Amanita thiersii Skay4041]